MKIWIVNHFAYAPDQSAGTRHYSLARSLEKNGDKVLIIASSFYHKAREERLRAGEEYLREGVDGVTFQWIKTPAYANGSFSRLWNMVVFACRVTLGRWFRREERPDVILGSSPSLLAALGAYLLAKRLKVPFVLEIRDIWPESLADLGLISKRNPAFIFFKKVEHYLYKRSDAILSVLPGLESYVKHELGKEKRVFWVPNGVDLKERPVLAQKNCRASPFFIYYMGAHGFYNGLNTVLDAVHTLKEKGFSSKDLKIVFMGDGPEKASLKTYAGDIGVDSLVEFRDSVQKKMLWSAIQDADAFLLNLRPMPSLERGLSPNKLWDYMAAGRPVIFATSGGGELAKITGAGISVAPGDSDDLASGIEQMVNTERSVRDMMGRKGRQYAEAVADMPNLALKLQKILRSVADKQPE